MSAELFNTLYTLRTAGGNGVSPAILAALRCVLVEGWHLAKAAKTHGVSRSGLYRALSKHDIRPLDTELVSVYCPVHRAAQLLGLIQGQLAVWADQDAKAKPASEPTTASNTGVPDHDPQAH